MDAGTRLRRVRERLGLTFRDVEQASYDVASQRGRSEFIVRISRLADIENRGVIPNLYKLYSLCAIYHLDPIQVFHWYDVPLEEHFNDGRHHPAPRTHLAAPPGAVTVPQRFDPGFDPRRTSLLSRMVERWVRLEAVVVNGNPHYLYGYLGLEDCTMGPLLPPGSLVVVNSRLRQVAAGGWRNEHERPIYFLELRDGYRCGWCRLDESRLILEPHPLSSCPPVVWEYPGEVELLGRVVGMAMWLEPE
jgi:transcriptional regulator with XRE-family HTH domain